MLDQLRQGAQGWVSKLLMIMLVASFAVWGIGGFEGYGSGTIATVGDAEISVQEFGRTYDQMTRAAQQQGQEAPGAEQVLSTLLHAAALEDEARSHNLGVSAERIGVEIAQNPNFQGVSGFDPNRFSMVLRDAGMDEDTFIEDVRRALVRDQLAESLGADFSAPQALVEALYRLQNEERTVSFITVDESTIEPVAAPGDATLQTWFDENRASFRAPEYRKLALLVLDPSTLAEPDAVTDEEIAAEYERSKADFTQEEKRRIQQIRFDSAEAANAALESVEGGKDFLAVAIEAGFAESDIDLGLKAEAEMIDAGIAEAGFAAELNKPVVVTENVLQPSLIRVTEIEAGSVTPLAEATAKIREDLARAAAVERVRQLYDDVEDERAGGATLEEIAKNLTLTYRVIEGVADDGSTPEGGLISDIPNEPQVLGEAFQSDVGVENSPIQSEGDVVVFFDVLDITEARDRTLDEVRDEAVTAWTAAETESRISAKAEELAARLRSGEPIATIAQEIGKEVQTVENVKRGAEMPRAHAECHLAGLRRSGRACSECRRRRYRIAFCSRWTR